MVCIILNQNCEAGSRSNTSDTIESTVEANKLLTCLSTLETISLKRTSVGKKEGQILW